MLKYITTFIKSLKQFGKFFSIILNIFFISLLFLLVSTHQVVAADHTHFYSEVSRLGVAGDLVLSREYRSDSSGSEAASDFFALNGVGGLTKCDFGDTCAHYDSGIDGFVLAITSGVYEANSLQAKFGPIGGEVWTQWEIWIDQDFVDDLPVNGIWKNTKLFRFHNYDVAGTSPCPHDSMDTLFIYDDGNRKHLRWEDTIEENAPQIDCKGSILIDQDDFGNQGSKWLRYTMYFNFNTKRVTWWVTDPATGTTKKRADEVRSNWLSETVDGIGPLLHISKRDDFPLPGHKTYTFGYRNMIVSTKPINFAAGTSPPVTSPEPSPDSPLTEPPAVLAKPIIKAN
ncbi:MAG: hypothetical protein PF690_11385 [Deltaproteobacteria bacterium]|jgi:hypothetical protein|nr:hypothetical protein [Deltaproteobacteria bacterium]